MSLWWIRRGKHIKICLIVSAAFFSGQFIADEVKIWAMVPN